MSKPVYWCGAIGREDDFGARITNEFIDGKSNMGPWGIFSPSSWARHSGTGGKLGMGLGQRYQKQPDGRWLKVEG